MRRDTRLSIYLLSGRIGPARRHEEAGRRRRHAPATVGVALRDEVSRRSSANRSSTSPQDEAAKLAGLSTLHPEEAIEEARSAVAKWPSRRTERPERSRSALGPKPGIRCTPRQESNRYAIVVSGAYAAPVKTAAVERPYPARVGAGVRSIPDASRAASPAAERTGRGACPSSRRAPFLPRRRIRSSIPGRLGRSPSAPSRH